MSKPLILMYHRIADEPVDYWGLAVSPVRFEEQLSVLRRTRRPLPLTDFVRDFRAGTLRPDAVAVTFDDGYVDNLLAGLPRLAAADVPATVFLATGYVDRPEPFWWDELAGFILLENGCESFALTIEGKTTLFELGGEPSAGNDRPTPAGGLTQRQAVLETIYQPLRRLHEDERRPIMEKLRSIFRGRAGQAALNRAMTTDEVRRLAAGGLVTIGAHTVTHPSLPELAPAARRREIGASKLACEALSGAPVTTFAYPFGEFDADAREAVKSAGFLCSCSTQRRPVDSGSDVFALPRIYIPNLDGDGFEQRIRWASAIQ
jgi:peptidoglycan/xylan/chitin deacetylase (PgdA/CDA1 family)